MSKEWGISYRANFGLMQTETIWVTSDDPREIEKRVKELHKHEQHGDISGLKVHVREVGEWQNIYSSKSKYAVSGREVGEWERVND